MQFQVIVFSVECVLRGCMEMKLKWNELFCFICILIAQLEIGANSLQKGSDDSILLVIYDYISLK
jgi:DUF1009 family protein